MGKKVNTKIWTLVNNIEPGVSKNLSWDDAWQKLATWGGFEAGVETKADGSTTADIWIGDTKVKVINIKDGWDEKERDWNWDQIYGQILDFIFDEGLIKKPRARRKDAKVQKVNKAIVNSSKTAQIAHETEKMSNYIAEAENARKNEEFEKMWYSEKNLTELKKKLGNLSVKKSDWKKKGKDLSEIESEMTKLKEQIKDIKNHEV